LKIETQCLHEGYTPKNGEPRVVPIVQSTTYVYDSSREIAEVFDDPTKSLIYSRFENPTTDAVEKKIAALEGGAAAMCTSSGQAATLCSILNICQAGDSFIASTSIYGGTINLFSITMKRLGIECIYVDPDATDDEIQAAFKDNTKLVFGETIANPALTVFDIERFANIAHKNGVPLIVDNTFATPYLCRPIEWGADIVIHSTSKYMDGHAVQVGGVIVESGKFDWKKSGKFPQLTEPNPSYHGVSFADAAPGAAFVTRIRAILLRDTGATLSPIHAFIFLQGLETLSLRVERHVENALKVVDFLNKHPKVEKVNHPSVSDDPSQQALYKKYFPNGGGSIFTFEIKGDAKTAQNFIDHLKLFSLLANVADVKSLVIHPASTTHAELNEAELADQGIKPNTIRLSIGTEHIDDIIYDLSEAFDAI
jgi:O-acetylhomoserine (thiol)-lyase